MGRVAAWTAGGLMRRFLLARLALSMLTLLLVSVIVFAVAEVLPGDVARTILGPYASNEQVARLNAELGLDRAFPVRYLDWITSFVAGDWGESALLRDPVRPIVLERLANSLILGLFAFALIVPVSIALGVVAAIKRRKPLDRVISITGLSLIAVPEFVTGIVVLVAFAVGLGWFPVTSSVPSWNPVDIVHQLLLPSIPLMLVIFGYVSRMARAGTIEVPESDYARTAVLKGLPRRTVISRHVLRNSLLPTISVVSIQLGYLVGGLVVVETMFNYPGIGLLVRDAAQGPDVTMLEATVLVVAAIYMVATLLADVISALLNPRVRLS
jgi:peptide/nickel transport system permease protein